MENHPGSRQGIIKIDHICQVTITIIPGNQSRIVKGGAGLKRDGGIPKKCHDRWGGVRISCHDDCTGDDGLVGGKVADRIGQGVFSNRGGINGTRGLYGCRQVTIGLVNGSHPRVGENRILDDSARTDAIQDKCRWRTVQLWDK